MARYLTPKAPMTLRYECHHCGSGRNDTYDIMDVFELLYEETDEDGDYLFEVIRTGYIKNEQFVEIGADWKHDYQIDNKPIEDLFNEYTLTHLDKKRADWVNQLGEIQDD